MTIHTVFLVLHIIAGFTALVVGAINIIGKKGNRTHRITGRLFFWSMLNVAVSAIALSIMKDNDFLLHIGVFVLYMNVAGYRSIQDKSLVPNFWDLGLLFIAGYNGVQMFLSGVIILIVFASINTALIINDLKIYRLIYLNHPIPKMTWLRRHIGMMLGTYLSTLTAFLVVNINLGSYNWVVWLLPTFLITPLIVLWTRKYRSKKVIKPVVVSMALLCISTLVWSANSTNIVVKGIVKDATTQTTLSYVNIGIVGTSSGTVSAPDGYFELYLASDSSAQTVRFSHLGYEDLDMQLQDIAIDKIIAVALIPAVVRLPDIEISSTAFQPLKMGYEKSDTRMNVYFAIGEQPNQNLGASIGKKFKVKAGAFRLDTLGFFIRHNDFDTVRFRINIQSIENSRPDLFLQQKEIITEVVGGQSGFIEVDLKAYDLVLQENFILSLEWIYSSKKGKYLQLPIAMPVLGSTHYYRYGSQNKWKVFRGMSSTIYVKGQLSNKAF
ncbi:MAG: carboxypeptidase-like regulatory domain-containing protein, partial [Bacteroidota bacterium]